ncbi:MAG: Glucose-1-phosphate cytidylyltransferase [Chlamydiae bacterium]|nr:Glucose-1-phosphate cytidylyltransferase [Chlamydiota bacterium]
MKTIILAGGVGARFFEKTIDTPKPLIEIGEKPLLWHIMHTYSQYQFNEFVVALGYKSYLIKEYFTSLYILNNDLSIELKNGKTTIHGSHALPWIVHLVDTGMNTQTGGRLKRLQKWIGHERFMLTYGDGLTDVDIDELLAFHKSHGKLATVLSVHPPTRFGELKFKEEQIYSFHEKPQVKKDWINGGFFVLEPEIFAYLENDETIWERDPLEKLAQEGELMGFKHTGFWQSMDTIHEWRYLQSLWDSGEARWLKDELLVR